MSDAPAPDQTDRMQDMPQPDPVSGVRALFDTVAVDYDQSGVAFFGPIAGRLVELLDVRAGEAVLDVGCGRGAVTLPVALAAGPTGSVTAVDVSPAMVEHTRSAVRARQLDQVTVEVMDATRPTLTEASFDVLASSLVLFFLPDPGAALGRWLRLLRPGGRLGITTFGEADPVFEALYELFTPYIPPQALDPRSVSRDSPFLSDASMERLVSACGGTDVRTVRQRLAVRFQDTEQWRRWTMSTGQRMFWGRMDDAQRGAVLSDARQILESARKDGGVVVRQDVRHTLARA